MGRNISKNQDIASPIYSLIRELRGYFPSHTLLQYTATPQANLLAALDDEFSPDFVRLLGVGEGYAGGRRFFLEEPGNIIREIPAGERINAMQDGNDRETPESLLHAFATFLLICADTMCNHGRTIPFSRMPLERTRTRILLGGCRRLGLAGRLLLERSIMTPIVLT